MKILCSIILATFTCLFCSCSSNEKTIVGKWDIVDIEFGTDSNPLLVSGVIATEKPTNVEFGKNDFKVMDDSKNVLEQKSYSLDSNILIIKDESGQTDSSKVQFISDNEINLLFEGNKFLKLKRKS